MAVIPVSWKSTGPSLASEIPSAYFYFFEDLEVGRLVARKFLRVEVISGAPIAPMALMFSRASSAVLKG